MNSRILRLALTADAVATGATVILLAVGSGIVAGYTDLPRGLLLGAGLALAPFLAFLIWTATRPAIPGWAVKAIVEINLLWAIASLALLASGFVAPNGLGVAFVAVQAVAVLGLGVAQWVALRQDEPRLA